MASVRHHLRPASGAALAALAVLLVGCGSLSTPAPTFSSFFNSVRAPATTTTATADDQPEFECPNVAVRQGAATLTVSADPREPTALNLRYQVGVGQTARECRLTAGVVTMRVGIEGRVVLGPVGSPGNIEVPLRFAVVQEGTEPKTIATKLVRIPVTIPPEQPNVTFNHIEEGLSFPMPRGGLIDSYVVYVGFDPLGATQEKKRPSPKKKAAPKLRGTT